jgi:hypothetical protein
MKGMGLLVENLRYLNVLKGRKKVMEPYNIKLIISALI